MPAKKATNLQPSLTATPKKQEKKDGLRKPQIRVLAALSKSKQPLSRSEIGEKAEVDVASLTEVIGSSDAEIRKKNDKLKGWKSLLTLGFVKATKEEGAVSYTITTTGKKALDAAK